MDAFFYEPFSQIMRLGLLADKMVRDREFGVSDAKVVVVCPEENLDYRQIITAPALRERFPDATTVEASVKRCLRNPDSFVMISPEALVQAIREQGEGESVADWLDYQHERYGY